MINVKRIKKDFPIFKRKINGKPLIYLDNAATSQKPRQVIEAMKNFYEEHCANVHRGIYKISEEATEKYEKSREKIAKFINAKPREIIFVKNTTEAINLVMYSWALENLGRGDEIISSIMEHHSNIVPWQFLQRKGVKLNFVDINNDGTLKMSDYKKFISKRTRLITVTNASNVLGTINPVKEICKMAHENKSLFLVDAAQSVPHMPVDVKELNCDFLVFSGHKMLGPSGIGVLYGKEEILEKMKPFLYGGDMIKEVHLKDSTFNDLPWKFEAGTPNIAGPIALGAAVDYLNKIGMNNVRQHEKEITKYALGKMQNIGKIKIYGPLDVNKKGGVISFNVGDIHSHDLASILNDDGIAIRTGHHCAMPLMKRLGASATARVSFYIYNGKDEIDIFVNSLERAKKVFRL